MRSRAITARARKREPDPPVSKMNRQLGKTDQSARRKFRRLFEWYFDDFFALSLGDFDVDASDLVALSNFVDSRSVAQPPQALIICGVIRRSTATDILGETCREARISIAPMRVKWSKTALVGSPLPYCLTKNSKVAPRPYSLSAAGSRFEVKNLGSRCQAASILFAGF